MRASSPLATTNLSFTTLTLDGHFSQVVHNPVTLCVVTSCGPFWAEMRRDELPFGIVCTRFWKDILHTSTKINCDSFNSFK